MAITARTAPTASKTKVGSREARRRQAFRFQTVALRPIVLFLGVLLTGAAAPAFAQRWNVETGVSVTGTATSNDGLAPKGQEQFNVLLDVSPRVSLIGAGPGGRLRVSGSLDLGAALSARLRGENRLSLRPQGALNANLEAIENFFFVDAGVGVQRSLESPFLATTSSTSPVNTFTSYQATLSPYIQGRLPGSFTYTVRSENSWTDSGQTEGQYSVRHSAVISRIPQPFGVTLSAERSVLDSAREGEPRRTTDVARISLRYSPDPQYAFGARAGWERNNYVLSNEGRTFWGVDATWRPNERTSLDAFWEDRFFGSSWQLGFSYRRPRLAFNIRTSRDISTTPQQFLTFPALANVVALLDAALTTRFPDPIERQRVIFDFLSRQQLPPELLTPTIVYDERVSLLTSISASVVLLGKRDSWAFSVFKSRTESIVGTSFLAPSQANNVQWGTELTYSRQLTPITSVSATGSWRRTESLLASSDDQSSQTQLRVQYTTKLSLRTDGSIGARYQWIDSNVTNDATEVAVFFSLGHRF